MFGMLDYRAHKLYALFSVPMWLVAWITSVIVMPIVAYSVGRSLGGSLLTQTLLSIGAMFGLEVLLTLIVKLVWTIFEAIFFFIIDVVPVNGRSKSDALAVVRRGDVAVHLWTMAKGVEHWTDELVEELATGSLFSRPYAERIRNRVHALRNFYLHNPSVELSEHASNTFLRENNLTLGTVETAITNPFTRNLILKYAFFLVLLVIRPDG